jgi:hypothetical protein
MKRLGFISAFLLLLIGLSGPATAATTINFGNAPTGTHLAGGTQPSCTLSGGVVTCGSYQLAGVGNTNASASLSATFSATVDCRNHGGQVVESHSQSTSVSSTTGDLSPKNGKMTVPSLSSAPAPTQAQFTALATCPNPNWTPEVRSGTIALTGFTYTLTFAGFSAPAISITG